MRGSLLAFANPLYVLAFLIPFLPSSFLATCLLTSQFYQRSWLIETLLDATRDAKTSGSPSFPDAGRKLITERLIRCLAF